MHRTTLPEMMLLSATRLHIVLICIFWLRSSTTLAACECGYRVHYGGTATQYARTVLYTDAIHVNFRALHDLSDSKDWKIKYVRFNYEPNSGRYGKRVAKENIVPNPVRDSSLGWDSPSVQGAGVDAGLQLIVRGQLTDNLVSTAQIQSRREDIQFGSFRSYMKTTRISGTCASHFWYNSDAKEIDMEMLSRQQGLKQSNPYPANLVVHSDASVADGNDARNTAGFIEGKMDTLPSDDFHEYRYDWSEDLVSFYSDGKWMGDLNQSVPAVPGVVQLSHWSDGNPTWTSGPPAQDAILTVAIFMGYFNTTDRARNQQFDAQCTGSLSTDRICDVADYKGTASSMGKGPSFVGVPQNYTGERHNGASHIAGSPCWRLLFLLWISVLASSAL
jgi:hypothetical protein